MSKEEFAHIRDGQEEPVTEAKVPWLSLLTYRQTWAFSFGKMLTDPVWWFYLFWMAKFLGKSCSESLRKAAHEIRAHARGLTAVMNRALAAPGSAEQRALLQTARASGDALGILARELTKLSQKLQRRR